MNELILKIIIYGTIIGIIGFIIKYVFKLIKNIDKDMRPLR